MQSNLINTSAKIFGGSAVAAVGLSFGKDVYKNATKKDTKDIIFWLVLGVAAVFGTYTGGVWLTRNYKTVGEAVWKRILAFFILIPSFLILLFSSLIFTGVGNQSNDDNGAETYYHGLANDESSLEMPEIYEYESYVDEADSFQVPLSAFFLPLGVLFVGMLSGYLQRNKREIVWEAEEYNANFMEVNQLVEHEDGTLEDLSTGQSYRIENVGKKRITLFALGRRGKRAYINLDTNGRYDEYTGLVKI